MNLSHLLKIPITIAFSVLFTVTFANADKPSSIQKSIEVLRNQLKEDGDNYELQIQLVNRLIDNSDYSAANVELTKLFKQYLKHPDKRVELYLLQARVYSLLNASTEAITYLLKAKESAFETKDHKGILLTGIELMEFYRRNTDYEAAKKTYYQYSYLAKKYNMTDPKVWNGLYNRFAAVNNEIGKSQTSVNYSNLALEEAKKMEDQSAMAISYNELGFAYKNLKDISKALENYQAARAIYEELGAYRDLVHVRLNIVYLLAHNFLMPQEEILAEAQSILELIDEESVDYQRSKPLELIKNFYEAKRMYKEAYYATEVYNFELSNEARRLNDFKITEIVEQYQNTKLKRENELIKLKAKNEEERLQSTRTQLILLIVFIVILTISFLVLNYFFRKSRRQNKLLDEQNLQKSLLIQEIHHRVKNNLQFVHSMLELQKNSLPEDDKENFHDLSRRINAMSLIHEQLYLSNDQQGINIRYYITSLMKHTASIFNQDQHIEISIEVPEIDVPVDKALPMGIICAELFNNAVKHAFINHPQPQFDIELKQSANTFVLKVTDNGMKQASTSSDKSSSGLGTRLIDIFSRQLKGEYTLNKTNGYMYTLEFTM